MATVTTHDGDMRDTGRSKVYAAENAVFEETLYEEQLGMAGVSSLSDHLFTDDWWIRHVNRYPEIVATRREAGQSHADARRQRIAFSLGGDTAGMLAHEAAHIAVNAIVGSVGIAAHGVEFRAVMVDVTALLCGPVMAERLERSYRSHGLDVGTRISDPPPVRHERGIYALWRIERQASAIGT